MMQFAVACLLMHLCILTRASEPLNFSGRTDLFYTRKNTEQPIVWLKSGSGLSSVTQSDAAPPRYDTSRIVAGYNASEDVYMHLAFVKMVSSDGRSSSCSGSILNSNTVLCAAHCFVNDNGFNNVNHGYVQIGQYRAKGKKYLFKSIHVHLKYNPKTVLFDIALVRVSIPFDMPYSRVHLPERGDKLPRRSFVYAAGYGITSYNGTVPETALETKLRLQSPNQCKQHFLNSPERWNPRLLLCAVDANYPQFSEAATCKGDSGGPLFVKNGSEMHQIGITSTGKKCKGSGGAKYTKLKAFTAQIQKKHKRKLQKLACGIRK